MAELKLGPRLDGPEDPSKGLPVASPDPDPEPALASPEPALASPEPALASPDPAGACPGPAQAPTIPSVKHKNYPKARNWSWPKLAGPSLTEPAPGTSAWYTYTWLWS